MKYADFAKWSKRAADWSQRYLETLRDRPVRAQVQLGEIAALLPEKAPEKGEDMERIFADFERIVPNGMTHWQHPRFFAYFPANASAASMVAEQLANTIAAQCMLWQTSPAATEIEGVMVGWLREALGLAPHFTGVIHDSATTATLSAILTMRERSLGWRGNESGLSGEATPRIYASAQCHSSIDKACRVAGIGQKNLVKVATDADQSMDPKALREAIAADRNCGCLPAGIVICVGGTATGASDRVAGIIEIAREENLYTHVDAAWAGSAMICPEFRPIWEGVDGADSIVFNPHKWLGAQFDCSVQFLADPAPQIRTLGLRPDYLQTLGRESVTNYNEWTIPLGRRFRALKLWFLMRAYGMEGLRERIRNHVEWVAELEGKLAAHPDFTITTPRRLSLFTFQFAPPG
ncbi:MAG: pyridoxal-dependent decarboxylase, partial [Pseudomonadota bacterium]|nr:pyridoxal-dependent decarboxylase [Pseudomonadota bacterium]